MRLKNKNIEFEFLINGVTYTLMFSDRDWETVS